MKALLIQARDPDDPMRAHEFDCFCRQSGLAANDLAVSNAVTENKFPVEAADVIFIGGSGAYSATANHPWMRPVLDAIHEIRETGKPLFGSCWGFHMIGKAFGAPVVTDETTRELGTYPVRLTADGEKDEFFSYLPSVFLAQLGHKDHIARLPQGTVHLASSETHRNQAFRIVDEPIYATQFHPELTAADMSLRVRHYLDHGYVDESEKVLLGEVLDRFQETPQASQMLRKFIEHFCV